MSIEYKRTGRFIRMDFAKWLSGNKERNGFHRGNTETNLKDGQVYAILYSEQYNSFIIEASDCYLSVWPSEIEALEISLEESLLEMGRDDNED